MGQVSHDAWIFGLLSCEEPRIFRTLDLISRGAQGHGPVHLLFICAAELGFAWNGEEKGLLVYMLLRPLMCLPPRSVLLGQLLLGRCGMVRCLWLTLRAVLHLLDGPVGVDPAFHFISHDASVLGVLP